LVMYVTALFCVLTARFAYYWLYGSLILCSDGQVCILLAVWQPYSVF
jgi:hypothetical protein